MVGHQAQIILYNVYFIYSLLTLQNNVQITPETLISDWKQWTAFNVMLYLPVIEQCPHKLGKYWFRFVCTFSIMKPFLTPWPPTSANRSLLLPCQTDTAQIWQFILVMLAKVAEFGSLSTKITYKLQRVTRELTVIDVLVKLIII